MLFSCSGLRPRCTSICASGSCERRRSIPSCAMRSAISILISSATFPCSTPIVPRSSHLCFKTESSQAHLHFIHCLYQVYFLEEAEMPHAENLSFQVLLSSTKDDVILLAQGVEESLGVDAFGYTYGCNGIRCILVVCE